MKSPLTSYTRLSPNYHEGRYYNGKNWDIDNITIHHAVGQVTVETLGAIFAPSSRRASSNYGIGNDGRIGCYVEEQNRAITSSNGANDARSITIEVADDAFPPYKVNNKAYEGLIKLLVDLVQRYPGLGGSLRWKHDKNLIYDKAQQNMTIHKWFSATACPGDWLEANMGKIADDVNARLKNGVTIAPPADEPEVSDGTMWRVQAGAFAKKENAVNQQVALEKKGFKNFITVENKLYVVVAGSYKQKSNATAQCNKIKAAGFDAAVVAK